jgi:MFS family permease
MVNNYQRVISIGLLIFSMGAIGCGIYSTFWRGSKHKNGYYYFTAMRFVIGIGESSIISLGYTIVNDLSPVAYKTVFMGIILVAAPVGVACGYGVTGGVLSFTSQYGAIFFVEGIFVTLCAIFCWFVPMHDYKIQQVVTEEEVGSEKHVTSPMIEDAEIELKSQTHEKEEKPPTIFQAIWPLFTNPVYVGIVLYSNVNGAILGALTFWCPSFFMYRLHNQDLSEGMKLTLANLGFAVIVLIASLVGTALGSIIVDKTGGVVGWKGIAKALFISTGFVGISIPWLFFGLVIETMHWVGLYILSFISIFFLMATTSPFQVALIAYVVLFYF